MVSPIGGHAGNMNRTDRLYAIGEELRRKGARGVTASALAERFEVSIRTIKRDVSALQQAGTPIWAQSGVGGGYHLADTANLPPINFTPAQAAAVSFALAALPDNSPFAVDVRAASAKILDALSDADRQRAEALAKRLWVLPAEGPTRSTAAVRHAVEIALAEQRALVISYRSADGDLTRRVVEPIILAAADMWYLVAHCRLRDGIRWFRIERIEAADLTNQHYEPHPVSSVGTPPPRARPAGS